MLRESINLKDSNFELGSITGGVSDNQDIPHASLLAEYAEIVVARDLDNITSIRETIIQKLGSEAFIDVAATIAGFHGVVRMADATGIPVVNEMSLSVSSELNVDHFYASGLGDRGS
jgi:hypothetical protein